MKYISLPTRKIIETAVETRTETAVEKVHNILRDNEPSVVLLLDLLAAFDTVDHKILLSRLTCRDLVSKAKSLIASCHIYLIENSLSKLRVENRLFMISLMDLLKARFKIQCSFYCIHLRLQTSFENII